MRSIVIIASILLMSISTGCSIYRMDIRQGNIVEQKDVDKIRKGMTKEQIMFVLGRPVIRDTFDQDTWYYVHSFKSGKTQKVTKKSMTLTFKDNLLVDMVGDFDIPAAFAEVPNS
ncbi:outer membrane protein assembly factor BamE [Pleionea sp. CnH1-48]|uniref:outer membrane protein assembly factor BamE n=1 Tax=Pleionea sp. CnH1-48 TaxID=2954494 RepID=UPI00209786B7|nr:outer membrane protein assembly factor BamE [Pleionea sp. CnH1-48]MCO7224621.1 outer membrane protein assembly factor BamE [Pleionea sp. CnH1-48]